VPPERVAEFFGFGLFFIVGLVLLGRVRAGGPTGQYRERAPLP